MLPMVATLIGAARHIFGLRSLGIYLALLTTFIFFKIGTIPNTYYSDPWMGLRYGIPLVLLVFCSTLLVYWMIKRLSIHYYPKLALVILGVTTILLIIIMVLGLLNFKNIFLIDAFTLVLIVSVSEKYFATLARKDLKTTLFISLESIILSTLCYLLISWHAFQDLMVNYPYLLLLLIPINILIGSFTGLRLSEYLRFWGIITDKN
jgi:hypothetical protein